MENTNKDIIDISKHRRNTVIEILKKLQEHDRVCCVRYTGYGKTYYIIKQLIDIFPNKQFLIFVPAKSLIKRYEQLFLNSNVIIKTYQSLLFMNDNEIADSFSNIDYMICDEAHRLGKNKWRQSIKNAFDIIDNGNTKIIGLTATPKRGDKINIVEDFFNGVETSRFELLDGIQAGYIPKVDYIVAYCDLPESYKEIYNKRMSDVDRYEIDKLLNVSNIIKEYITEDKLEKNLKVVMYVPRLKEIEHAQDSCYKWFTEAFPNKNINVFSLSSEYTDKENNDYLDKYSNNDDDNSIDIMVSCNKLNEGLHLPMCSVAILLRKTISPIVYFQQIGRAINESKPVIFDLVNNSSHIRQVKGSFKIKDLKNVNSNISTNSCKNLYNSCINLIPKTKDIEDILLQYKRQDIDYETKLMIINETDLSIDEISNKYDVSKYIVRSVFREFGMERIRKSSDIANRLKIIKDNIDYIVNNIGLISLSELEDKFKLPRASLGGTLKSLGYNTTEIRKNNISTVKNKVKDLVLNGISCDEISSALGIPTSRVCRYSLEMGLHVNGSMGNRKGKWITPTDEHQIYDLYIKCHSFSEIQRITGRGFDTIKKVLNRKGIV